MAGWALALWILYFAVAFAARLLLQRLVTGSFGISGIRGGPVAWLGGLLFLGALGVSAAAPVLDLRDTLEPVDALDAAGFHALGFALYGLGLLGTISAQLAMGTSWRIGVGEEEKTELVMGGPFETCRNPIYTAMLTAVAGLALLAPNAVALAGWGALLVALEIQVRLVEEPYLGRAHGSAFRDYAGQVGRFLPGLGRLT